MHQFTIHPSSIILHHIITSPHHPIIQLPACKKSAKICEKNLRKSARNSSSHHHITTSPHHPTSNMQKICEKLIIPSSLHNSITSFAFISGFSSTKFSGVRLGIKRSERSNISTKKARYNNIIIGFCSERTEYKLKG